MSYQQGGYGQQQGGYGGQPQGGPPPRRGNFPPVQPEYDHSSARTQGDNDYNSRGGGYQQDNGYPPRHSAGGFGGQQDNGYPPRQPATATSQGYEAQGQQNQGGYAQQPPAPAAGPVVEQQQQGWNAQAPQQGWNTQPAPAPTPAQPQPQAQWNAPSAPAQPQWGAPATGPPQAEHPPQQQQQGWGAQSPAPAPPQPSWNAGPQEPPQQQNYNAQHQGQAPGPSQSQYGAQPPQAQYGTAPTPVHSQPAYGAPPQPQQQAYGGHGQVPAQPQQQAYGAQGQAQYGGPPQAPLSTPSAAPTEPQTQPYGAQGQAPAQSQYGVQPQQTQYGAQPSFAQNQPQPQTYGAHGQGQPPQAQYGAPPTAPAQAESQRQAYVSQAPHQSQYGAQAPPSAQPQAQLQAPQAQYGAPPTTPAQAEPQPQAYGSQAPQQSQYGAQAPPSAQAQRQPHAYGAQPQAPQAQYGAPPATHAQAQAQPQGYGSPTPTYGGQGYNAPIPGAQAFGAPPPPAAVQQVYPAQQAYGGPPSTATPVQPQAYPAPSTSTYAPSQSAYPASQQAAYAPSTQVGYAPSTQGGFTAPPTPFPPSSVAPTPVPMHAQPQGHGMMPPPGPIPAGMQQGRPEKVRESDFVNPSNDIERRLNELSLKSLNLTSYVARPGFGTQGKPIGVLANIFAARFKDGKGKTIHHYDIDIDPVVKVSSQKKPVTLLRAVWERLTLGAQGPWAAPFQAAAFDGRKNAFTPIPFPIEGPPGTKHQIIIALPEEGATDADEARRFKIVIKHVADVDLESLADFCRSNSQSQHAEEMMLTAVMSVNVLLRDQPTKKYCSVGASGNRFFGLSGAVDLPGGAIVCRGFMQSFRYTNSGNPGVQIDTAYSAFSASGRLLDVAAKILGMGGFTGGGGRGGFGGPPRGGFGGGRGGPPPAFGNHGGGPGGPGFGGPGGPPSGPPGAPRSGPGDQLQTLQPGDIAMLKSKLKLAKFKVTHRPSSRIFTIMSITQQPAEDITFVLEGKDGAPDRKLDICTYFKEMYGVTVTKPRLPCIAYGRKGFIPMEFVEIEPFHSLPPMRLSSDQTAEMIKVSARPPRERADHIMNWRRELAYERQQKIAAWGIEINPQMMNIEARVLAPPNILYGGGQDVRANNGSWSLRGKRFVRDCTPLKAWSVVSFDRYCDQPKMASFVARLVHCLRSHGITVETDQPPLLGPFNPNQDGSIRQGLGDAAGGAFRAGGRAPQLVIVLLPGRDQWIYESIKRTAFCDLKAPIPTQCLQTMKLKNERGLDQYCDNVSMKIHVKLGGLTHQVPLSSLPNCDKSTMLVGVDVTHPPPKPGSDLISPSVAVAVATYNETCDAYACQIRLQEGREETCQDLASMMEAHVRLFEDKNGIKPTKLIVFRDGVSEGQYAAVVQTEFDAILRGCRAVHHDYRPQVSFVIAAKRHNMRFFAADPGDTDRSGNLPPGLVVDKGVVHPFAFDFYLQAHAGLVGTSRPTHYLALIDEIKFTPDQLHRLVNALCYSFVRATRSVSLIPVAYTADIICSQVRTMIHDGSPSEPTESEYSSVGGYKPRKTRDFDPLKLQNLLAKNPEMASVAWYM